MKEVDDYESLNESYLRQPTLRWELPTLEEALTILPWRNDALETLRTPYPLSIQDQTKWYNEHVADRKARDLERWWSLRISGTELWAATAPNATVRHVLAQPGQVYFIAFMGLHSIDRRARRGEISLIINPGFQRQGYGRQCLMHLMRQGFYYENLYSIYGECYTCNPNLQFWKHMVNDYRGIEAFQPATKFYNGNYSGSYLFTFLEPQTRQQLLRPQDLPPQGNQADQFSDVPPGALHSRPAPSSEATTGRPLVPGGA